MKVRTILVFLCVLLSLGVAWNAAPVHAATVDAVYGSTPTLDGVLSPGEWEDASVTFVFTMYHNTVVYVKQNGSHLHIGLIIEDGVSEVADCLWIAFDTLHDAWFLPNPDDYLFQIFRPVAGWSVVESQGTGGGWVPQPSCVDWTGAASAGPGPWQVEVSISYAKLGVTPGVAKQMGLEFIVHDGGPVVDDHWTASSNTDIPFTWGDITSTADLWVPWFTSLPMVLLAGVSLVIFYRKRSH